MKVFLGGTCNNSDWRDLFIDLLDIDYFNPIVDDWNEVAFQRELKEKKESDICLYCITAKMTGVYSIAEVVHDSIKNPEKTVLCVLYNYDGKFSKEQEKSLKRIEEMIKSNGSIVFNNLMECANYLNSYK